MAKPTATPTRTATAVAVAAATRAPQHTATAAAKPSATPTPVPAHCRIKGNINGGDKVYHTPDSPHYQRTQIDTALGERWFCTEQEAAAAGWRAPASPAQRQTPTPTAGCAGRYNLNAATVAELDTLPGIGPILAGRIVDYRAQHGDFGSVDELVKVRGIAEKRLAKIRDCLYVE